MSASTVANTAPSSILTTESTPFSSSGSAWRHYDPQVSTASDTEYTWPEAWAVCVNHYCLGEFYMPTGERWASQPGLGEVPSAMKQGAHMNANQLIVSSTPTGSMRKVSWPQHCSQCGRFHTLHILISAQTRNKPCAHCSRHRPHYLPDHELRGQGRLVLGTKPFVECMEYKDKKWICECKEVRYIMERFKSSRK